MKNKGIPVWEMYFEYIVLCVAATVAVGLIGWQFLASNTSQSVAGLNEEVTPSNVDRLLIQEAERIESFVEPNAPIAFEIQDPDQRSDEFVQQLASGVAPDESLNLPEYRIVLVPESDEQVQYAMAMVFTPEKALNLRAIPIVFQDWPDYGKKMVLQVPKGTYVMGPEQADAVIDQEPGISQKLSWWNRRGMEVIRGHTVLLPIRHAGGDEVLYVEPIFLRSEQNPVSQLKKVAVVFRDKVALGDTLADGLNEVLALHRGAASTEAGPSESGPPAHAAATGVRSRTAASSTEDAALGGHASMPESPVAPSPDASVPRPAVRESTFRGPWGGPPPTFRGGYGRPAPGYYHYAPFGYGPPGFRHPAQHAQPGAGAAASPAPAATMPTRTED